MKSNYLIPTVWEARSKIPYAPLYLQALGNGDFFIIGGDSYGL